MIRIEGTADKKYIEKLLAEIEFDNINCYEIKINEQRENADIININITVNRVESINF